MKDEHLEKEKQPELKVENGSDSNGKPEDSSNDIKKTPCPEVDLGDRWEVLELFGSGGMGSVYKAHDRDLDKTFAVKLLEPKLLEDPAAVKRFKNQVNIVKDLDHPYLVNVYGHDEAPDGTPYVVMDFIEGKTLQEISKEETALDTKRAVNLFIQIAEAIVYAHEKGVLHRDVKPSNIIISKNQDGKETVHIVDFGIAQAAAKPDDSSTITQTGEILGSALYMSPEQCRGEKLDERSDIYAFGCVMFESLSGNSPFAAASPVQTIIKHLEDEPPELKFHRKSDRQMEGWIDSVVARCLAKHRDLRYPKMKEVLDDLRTIESNNAPSIEPLTSRAARLIKKNEKRLILPLALIGIILMFCGVEYAFTLIPETMAMFFMGPMAILFLIGTIYVLRSKLKQKYENKLEHYSLISLLVSMAMIFSSMILTIGTSYFKVDTSYIFYSAFTGTFTLIGAFLFFLSAFTLVLSKICSNLKTPLKKTTFLSVSGVLLLVFFLNINFLIPVTNFFVKSSLGFIGFQSNKLKKQQPKWMIEPAIAASGLVLLFDRDNAQTYENIGWAYLLENDLDKALETVNEGIKRNPNARNLYDHRIALHSLMEKHDKLLNDYNQLIRLQKSPSPYLLNRRGDAYIEVNQLDKAEDDLKKAIELSPDREEAYTNLGKCYLKMNKYELAIQNLDKAIELNKNSWKAWYIRALVYEKLGKDHLAYKNFNKILRAYTSGADKMDLYFYKYLTAKHTGKDFSWYKSVLQKEGYRITKDDKLMPKIFQ